jgi:hypothetical protein
VQDAFAAQGIAPKGTTAEWTSEFFKSEYEKYAKVIQQTGIKGE